jgi:hypothetical protein
VKFVQFREPEKFRLPPPLSQPPVISAKEDLKQ